MKCSLPLFQCCTVPGIYLCLSNKMLVVLKAKLLDLGIACIGLALLTGLSACLTAIIAVLVASVASCIIS